MQNAPWGAFCNTFDLHYATIFHKDLCFVIFKCPLKTGFSLHTYLSLQSAYQILNSAAWHLNHLTTSELRVRLVPWNQLKPSSKIFQLTVPRRYFICGSFLFFLSCVCYAFVRVCLFVHLGHLLGKDWPFGSRLWCLTVSLSLSHRYSGSSTVLDCIDYWSLHVFLLPNDMNWICRANANFIYFWFHIWTNFIYTKVLTFVVNIFWLITFSDTQLQI